IFLSLTRQLLFLLPGLYFLPRFIGVEGVWVSMPVSDFVATVVAAVLLWHQFRIFKRADIKQ
ncbi:MAG: MATE family efflux transporter, partial [Bacteroides sp.]